MDNTLSNINANENNKHSMEKKVNKVLERLSMQVISLDEARAEMRILGLFNVVGQSEQLVCPECKSTDCKTAIHTDYKECNKCYHYWEAR